MKKTITIGLFGLLASNALAIDTQNSSISSFRYSSESQLYKRSGVQSELSLFSNSTDTKSSSDTNNSHKEYRNGVRGFASYGLSTFPLQVGLLVESTKGIDKGNEAGRDIQDAKAKAFVQTDILGPVSLSLSYNYKSQKLATEYKKVDNQIELGATYFSDSFEAGVSYIPESKQTVNYEISTSNNIESIKENVPSKSTVFGNYKLSNTVLLGGNIRLENEVKVNNVYKRGSLVTTTMNTQIRPASKFLVGAFYSESNTAKNKINNSPIIQDTETKQKGFGLEGGYDVSNKLSLGTTLTFAEETTKDLEGFNKETKAPVSRYVTKRESYEVAVKASYAF